MRILSSLTVCGGTLIIYFSILQLASGNVVENIMEYALQKYQVKENRLSSSFDKVFVWDSPLLSLQFTVNANIDGFLDIDTHEASVTPDLKVRMNVTLNDATLGGTYSSEGIFYKILPLEGNGNFKIELKGFNTYFITQIVPSNGTVQLTYFDVDYNFDDLVVSITGMTGKSDIGMVMEAFIRDFVPHSLKNKKSDIIPYLSKFVMTRGNELLKGVTLRTVVEIMKYLFVY